MKKQLAIRYEEIISVENLLGAWQEFLCGKRSKVDVQLFQLHLMDNILVLHQELKNLTYTHGGYKAFKISDPKPRDIHKAIVRDRLLHHAIYRKLYQFFDTVFIPDSYSCRLRKGTHLACNRFRAFASKVSRNDTRTCWVLKCDIRKFFASIDHQVMYCILDGYIPDEKIVWLLMRVIRSFSATKHDIGLPLGNLTSQLLVNIYMNEFDQFVKHRLKARYYIRYADDFVIMSDKKVWLEEILPQMQSFLADTLKLSMHPHKVSITTVASGVDFLGWVHFPDHRVLRRATRRRFIRGVVSNPSVAAIVSYRGLLSHGNTHTLHEKFLIER